MTRRQTGRIPGAAPAAPGGGSSQSALPVMVHLQHSGDHIYPGTPVGLVLDAAPVDASVTLPCVVAGATPRALSAYVRVPAVPSGTVQISGGDLAVASADGTQHTIVFVSGDPVQEAAAATDTPVVFDGGAFDTVGGDLTLSVDQTTVDVDNMLDVRAVLSLHIAWVS